MKTDTEPAALAKIMAHSGRVKSALMLYHVLASLAGEQVQEFGGTACRASLEDFTRWRWAQGERRLTADKVFNALSELARLGIVQIETSGPKKNIYRLMT